MKQARIAELKNNLSQYVARVRAGETITVLDRNRPVARLVPIATVDRKVAMNARLVELERKGWIRPALGGLPKFMRKRPIRVKGSVLKELLAERESGW
jgi:prevent-host-death family protein